MVFLVVVMLLILVVCGVISAYVAYPHRGEEVPGAPWLGEALAKAAEALPVIDEDDRRPSRHGSTPYADQHG